MAIKKRRVGIMLHSANRQHKLYSDRTFEYVAAIFLGGGLV